MKKFLSILMVLAMMLTMSAAFAETDWASRRLPETVELTFMIDRDQSLEGWEAVFAKIEEVLNIKTTLDLRPGGTEGDNLVKSRLATGDMADLCAYNSGSLFKVLNPSAYFVDLSNEPWAANLDQAFKNSVSVDGVLYGAPSGATQVGAWMYNKEIHAELGLEVPHTWDDLIANCQKIKDAGITPVIGGYKDSWTSQLIVLGDHYNVVKEVPDFAAQYDANKAHFSDTPAALHSFEKLYQIHEMGFINEDLNSTSYDMALEMLVEGQGVYYPMLSFALPYIEENYPEGIDKIGYFGQPGDDPEDHGVTVWLPGGVYIANTCENIDAAKLWLEYFLSPEATELMAQYSKPTGPYAVIGLDVEVETFEAVKELQPYFDEGRTAAALEFESPLKGPNLPQITQECGSGIATPEEAAQKYDQDVAKQAIQLGMEGWE